MRRQIILFVFILFSFWYNAVAQEANKTEPIPVFPIGEKPYSCYRIPALISLPNGDLLAFAEGRTTNCADFGNVDVVMKRSKDDGRSWSEMAIVVDNGGLQAGNCAPVADLTDPNYPNGRIFLFYNTGTSTEDDVRHGKGLREVWYVTSIDQGYHWSEPVNITSQVHKPNQSAVNSKYNSIEDWRAFANTPGHALQLTSGRYKGRIYVAANHSRGNPLPNFADFRSFGYFTDDHGQSFHISEELPFPGSNEATAAELVNGGLYLNARNQTGDPRFRIAAFSKDGGASWDTVYCDAQMPDPVCEGSVLNVDPSDLNKIVVVNPASQSHRENLTLRYSRDGGRSWNKSWQLVPGEAAYNDVCLTKKNHIGCLFEKGSDGGIYFLTFVIPD